MNDYVLKMKISVIFTFHKPINWDWWPKPVTPHIWEVEEEGSQACLEYKVIQKPPWAIYQDPVSK